MRCGGKNRKVLCAVALAGILLFIWGNSLLDKPMSAGLSSWVLEELLGGLPWLSHTALRKLAHFVEFAVLGILLSWLLANKIKKTWAFALPTAVLGCLAACMDEMLQHFSPGRGPRFADVVLDTAGVLFGIGIFSLGYAIKKKK
jgi:glycopeptide antibiotics resistance protein